MIALKLPNNKQFMSHLLLSETFDHFLVIDGEITTFNTFTINGFLQKEFYPPEERDTLPEYSYWKQLRELCFTMIRGKQTPLGFIFVFSLAPHNIEKLLIQKQLDFRPEDVQGLYLNIRFNQDGLFCITGTSLKTFSMDKSLEQAWDEMVQKFFTKKQIDWELC